MKILLYLVFLLPMSLFASEQALPNKQLTCLVDNAYYEAYSEGKIGVLLVTQVVLNRARTYDESYCQTIYKKGQFSWTATRKLKKIPLEKRKELEILITKFYKGKLNYLPKNLKDAMFYHANYVNPPWFKTRVKIGVWKNHIFYS